MTSHANLANTFKDSRASILGEDYVHNGEDAKEPREHGWMVKLEGCGGSIITSRASSLLKVGVLLSFYQHRALSH